MSTPVTAIEPANQQDAIRHFANRLSFETDCWDVHESLNAGKPDFALIDVRSPAMYERSHIPGAINIPYGKMIESYMSSRFFKDTLFVVYCAGPHCNGANKAALRLARLGYPVKDMIGGMTGWADEGFAFAPNRAVNAKV